MNLKRQARHKASGKFSYTEAFRNEDGAIDLSSIMVGIIVIGLIGGVIAATVFAVIPWSQDNAAKHQLDSVAAAQSAYMGLSSDSPPALPAGHKANSFADSAALASANLLQAGSTYCTVSTEGGKSYDAFSKSSSGKVFKKSNNSSKAIVVTSAEIPSDCAFVAGNGVAAYVDPTPTKTTMTYRCAADNVSLTLPWKQVTGKITWSDGVNNTYATETATPASRVATAGITYTVTLDGTFKNFSASDSTDQKCIISLDHWGSASGTQSAFRAFQNASNLESVPEHLPTSLTDISEMFSTATKFNDPKISKWDTSNVTNMSSVFYGATAFNQSLNGWDVSGVTNMTNMFYAASNFNQPLDKWQTGNVTGMKQTFASASKFNQNINSWDVSKVTTMEGMFHRAYDFNQPLNDWKVDNVGINNSGTDNFGSMMNMFYEASKFNQPLDKWNTINVKNMNSTFFAATAFNQDLSGWKVPLVVHRTNFANPEFNANYLPTFSN